MQRYVFIFKKRKKNVIFYELASCGDNIFEHRLTTIKHTTTVENQYIFYHP